NSLSIALMPVPRMHLEVPQHRLPVVEWPAVSLQLYFLHEKFSHHLWYGSPRLIFNKMPVTSIKKSSPLASCVKVNNLHYVI
ncbi:hypothetical protein OB236_17005, partial [Paenibacillus sp. WQ 127069]